MDLEAAVFDVWVFRRRTMQPEYLLLHTSRYKADRYFNGGRFWQIPSDFVREQECVVPAIQRQLGGFGLTPAAIWAAEHAEYRWCAFDAALGLVTYRGLKDGLRSTREFITAPVQPLRELQLL